MIKHAWVFALASIIYIALAVAGVAIIARTNTDLAEARAALRSFRVVNGKNAAAAYINENDKLLASIADDEGIPLEWLQAVLHHENGLAFHEAGCKKYFQDLERYPVSEWQPRSCARIIAQEWRAFMTEPDNEVRFSKYLYDRYFKHNDPTGAARDVLLLKRKYAKQGGKQ